MGYKCQFNYITFKKCLRSLVLNVLWDACPYYETLYLPTDKGNYHEVSKIDVLAELAFLKWGLGANDKKKKKK